MSHIIAAHWAGTCEKRFEVTSSWVIDGAHEQHGNSRDALLAEKFRGQPPQCSRLSRFGRRTLWHHLPHHLGIPGMCASAKTLSDCASSMLDTAPVASKTYTATREPPNPPVCTDPTFVTQCHSRLPLRLRWHLKALDELGMFVQAVVELQTLCLHCPLWVT